MGSFKHFTNGLIKENPTFRLLLGMCPTLAVTTSAINGLGMGLATTVVPVSYTHLGQGQGRTRRQNLCYFQKENRSTVCCGRGGAGKWHVDYWRAHRRAKA